jgi:TIR domain/Pentapeptide repeats (8 copies)
LTRAYMHRADLLGSQMTRAICTQADLRYARLTNASLSQATFERARLTGTAIGSTVLTDIDLRPFIMSKRLYHHAPSFVDSRSVLKSYTHPDLKQFMLDCGTPDTVAEYMIDSARAVGESVVHRLMSSTFISYGRPDETFARKLYESLRAHGVTTFFFPETAKVGERISEEVFKQIQAHDKVLLICSRKSLRQAGALTEIREILDRESRDGGATYLLPIMLDSYVLEGWRSIEPGLADRVSRRVIASFQDARKDERAYSMALSRVLDALKIEPLQVTACKRLDAESVG